MRWTHRPRRADLVRWPSARTRCAAGRQRDRGAAPVLAEHELARLAAAFQAGVLELGELEAAGGGEHRTAHQPLVFMPPVNRVDSAVHAEVERQRQRAERRPDELVASEQAGHGRAGARMVRGREREQPNERQARGQHHRRKPHLPGHQKRRQRDPERRRAREQDIVMHGGRHATDLRRDRYRLPRHSAGATSSSTGPNTCCARSRSGSACIRSRASNARRDGGESPAHSWSGTRRSARLCARSR
jgi:hypothetical protein